MMPGYVARTKAAHARGSARSAMLFAWLFGWLFLCAIGRVLAGAGAGGGGEALGVFAVAGFAGLRAGADGTTFAACDRGSTIAIPSIDRLLPLTPQKAAGLLQERA